MTHTHTHTIGIHYKIRNHASPYPVIQNKTKMVPYTDKYDKVGKNRLKQIHSRVNYMAEECGFNDKDTPPNFKVHELCICCVQKLQPHDKFKVDVSPNTQNLYIRCSGLAWLCRARDKLITTRRMI